MHIESQVKNIASYLCWQYKTTYDTPLDEMKLHKLMYFIQRQALADTGQPLFQECFKAWKYGPVLLSLRYAYKHGTLSDTKTALSPQTRTLVDHVFNEYAPISSWSLSNITHSELSWVNGRKGLADGDNGNNDMAIQDIQKDAERMKMRQLRIFIKQVSSRV